MKIIPIPHSLLELERVRLHVIFCWPVQLWLCDHNVYAKIVKDINYVKPNMIIPCHESLKGWAAEILNDSDATLFVLKWL